VSATAVPLQCQWHSATGSGSGLIKIQLEATVTRLPVVQPVPVEQFKSTGTTSQIHATGSASDPSLDMVGPSLNFKGQALPRPGRILASASGTAVTVARHPGCAGST
jgi:hypothetical protein